MQDTLSQDASFPQEQNSSNQHTSDLTSQDFYMWGLSVVARL